MPPKIKLYRTKEAISELKGIEQSLQKKGYRYIAGADEAGRGPLAGPVVAAAVILPEALTIDGLNDSKKLTPTRREELFEEIIASGAVCAVGVMDNDIIDRTNILKASLLAMRKAVISLEIRPQFILVDGLHPIPNLDTPQYAIVGGDALCQSISAASIIAKVTRDRIMDKYQELYPDYSFSCHRGYPTARHFDELKNFGPTEIHRKTFRPVVELINKSLFD